MTADYSDIGKYIKDIASTGIKTHSVVGYVKKTDVKEMTCTVESADKSATYYNVRLKEISKKDEPENGFWMIPEENSKVIIDCISPNEAYISMMSEVTKVHHRVKKMRVGLSETGFSIDQEGGKDFKTLLDELFKILTESFKVQTAWGPSGLPMPDVIQSLNDLKAGFAEILVKGEDNAGTKK